jgi:hypothetical protein
MQTCLQVDLVFRSGMVKFFFCPAVGSYRMLPTNAGRSIVAVVDVLRLLLHVVGFYILGL